VRGARSAAAPASGVTLCVALGLALGLAGCTRKAAPAPPATQAPAPLAAWAWHPLGSLAVVEGEVAEPTHLVLEGRSLRETRFAEPGPVRWEFFRPPEGESAVLRTAEGRELARFRFVREVAQARSPKGRPAPAPKLAQQPGAAPVVPPPTRPAAPAVAPPAPQPEPRTLSLVRLRSAPVGPLADRRSPAPLTTPAPVPTPAPAAATGARSRFIEPVPAAALQAQIWPGMGEALNLTRGPGGRKRLLLSFDGGSNAEVASEILDTLKARGVRTTIFLTGAFIQRFPALVKRMAAEGHELGNHTMNHPHFAPGLKRDPKWTRERVQRELLEADAALVRLLGRPMDPYWRAPYGEHTAEVRRWAEELGYRHVGWSEGADTLDWATPKEHRLYRSGDAILQRLRQRLNRDGDGLIVLMHLGSERIEKDRPSAGLGAFMDRASREGWTFVAVGTFLHDLGKPAWDPQLRLALLQPPGSAAQGR